ncbi:MAG: helix-turn-helix transcriptional regulator [Pseudomonadota bacterium]
MILDVELLQLYRCKQLVDLLNRVGQIFEVEGFPYLSLEWTPAPSNASTMLSHASLVWDNYGVQLGDQGLSLSQKMAKSFSIALRHNKVNTLACQSWKVAQSETFCMRAAAPEVYFLTEYQRGLIESYDQAPWTEFVAYAVCRERDCVLLITAKTQREMTPKMLDVARKIMAAFASAYRYLHSQSIVLSVGETEAERLGVLSRREVECLQWLALGKTLSEAAIILGISERTLRFHVNNARERLGVSTTMQAVVSAALLYGFDPNDTRDSIYTKSREPMTTKPKQVG